MIWDYFAINHKDKRIAICNTSTCDEPKPISQSGATTKNRQHKEMAGHAGQSELILKKWPQLSKKKKRISEKKHGLTTIYNTKTFLHQIYFCL